MPVLDHVGAGGEIGVDVEPELAVVGRELPGRIPAQRLRIGFRHQEVLVLERAGEVALQRLPGAVEMVLRAVVGIVGDDIERLGNLDLVDVELHHGAVVLGHELVRAPGLAHQRSLKGEKVGDAHLLPARPLQFVTGAGGIVAGRHVGPVVDVLAPVIEEPGLVERVGGAELFLQVVDEAAEDVLVGSAVGAGLVIDLPADDRGIVFVVRDQVGDDALGVETELRDCRCPCSGACRS